MNLPCIGAKAAGLQRWQKPHGAAAAARVVRPSLLPPLLQTTRGQAARTRGASLVAMARGRSSAGRKSPVGASSQPWQGSGAAWSPGADDEGGHQYGSGGAPGAGSRGAHASAAAASGSDRRPSSRPGSSSGSRPGASPPPPQVPGFLQSLPPNRDFAAGRTPLGSSLAARLRAGAGGSRGSGSASRGSSGDSSGGGDYGQGSGGDKPRWSFSPAVHSDGGGVSPWAIAALAPVCVWTLTWALTSGLAHLADASMGGMCGVARALFPTLPVRGVTHEDVAVSLVKSMQAGTVDDATWCRAGGLGDWTGWDGGGGTGGDGTSLGQPGSCLQRA
jgi:hypothetical protein